MPMLSRGTKMKLVSTKKKNRYGALRTHQTLPFFHSMKMHQVMQKTETALLNRVVLSRRPRSSFPLVN